MLTVSMSDLTPWFESIEDRLEHLPMDEIGRLLVAGVRDNIDSEGQGSMAPRVPPTGSWPLLKKSGAMYNSIHANILGDEIEVDSDADYAGYLDQGTSKMVARHFLYINPETEDQIMDLIGQSL